MPANCTNEHATGCWGQEWHGRARWRARLVPQALGLLWALSAQVLLSSPQNIHTPPFLTPKHTYPSRQPLPCPPAPISSTNFAVPVHVLATPMCVHACVYACVCACVSVTVCMFACMRACVRVCVRVYLRESCRDRDRDRDRDRQRQRQTRLDRERGRREGKRGHGRGKKPACAARPTGSVGAEHRVSRR